ncbi:glutamate--cysteine ligase [Legionella sp. W05-934-2]|jgi:glutamate--cysteine ligase|uniref:glutamate--cysteine ligase n=1 Tax=Legionella sp. W05-934-2 TaxID=1198649 RepID=UPI003463537E
MLTNEMTVPHITTAYRGPLHLLEKKILSQVNLIEDWFRKQWTIYQPPLTTSVDLRHAGFKLAPVDTNLFPAGFNNLNAEFLPLCVQAMQATLANYQTGCKRVLILPETHTRNPFYTQSLSVLRGIVQKAGYEVRIGSLDGEKQAPYEVTAASGETILYEPVIRKDNHIMIDGFKPCLVLLNNDLSSGIPDSLKGLEQTILPTTQLGWTSRLKSTHFRFYKQVAQQFAELIDIDPWLVNPDYASVEGIDFMAQEGLEQCAQAVDTLLSQVKQHYQEKGIRETPFAVVKADNGTYGMSVMMVHDGDDVRNMNRKLRTKMAASKGSQKVSRVIVQEGVHTFETVDGGAVAEPVVYMIGPYVVGGFYRVHQGRGRDENLNAPGMHFVPLAFAEPCNMPDISDDENSPNRFYIYGVIARLGALAAAYELAAIESKERL